MANNKDYNPLMAAVPPEVPLTNAPLVRVISQVRFPIIVSIEKRDFIGPFQEAIRSTYPVLRAEQTRSVIIGSQAIEPLQSQTAWRFSDVEGKWRASLSPGFVALETTSYTSRSDFLQRLRVLLGAVNTHIGPKIADRLGIRYIDRVTGEQFPHVDKLVKQEMLGILTTPAAGQALQVLSEALFDIPHEKGQMQVRWGRLPAKATIDPGAIEPDDRPSWILDIDMFSTEHSPFDPEKLITDARSYAERIYTFFRWAVTKDFLREYGGTI